MQITRTNVFTGETRTRDLPITNEQWRRYKSGELIQRALSHLSVDDREWILTGMTPEEWNKFTAEEEPANDPTVEDPAF